MSCPRRPGKGDDTTYAETCCDPLSGHVQSGGATTRH
eukprot:CAMPEP_0204184706 /NCGR_PEP_ID=MMETSP0361-20130328/54672_1 /ASSEMBLY_ACC=CAM_ASM_000343 /TAXON_ID=268821 /ORGANISM="Scrippsiella Hangoei, Strain SHTV-5" /LENGTH=36 /DNA_ID= /DNA_START= /DNA_END= /DNA_ORIENTATION=